VQTVQTLEEALGRGGRSIAIFAGRGLRVDDLAKNLARDGTTEIKLHLELAERGKVIEFALGANFTVSPRQLSALKTLPGVLRIA